MLWLIQVHKLVAQIVLQLPEQIQQLEGLIMGDSPELPLLDPSLLCLMGQCSPLGVPVSQQCFLGIRETVACLQHFKNRDLQLFCLVSKCHPP